MIRVMVLFLRASMASAHELSKTTFKQRDIDGGSGSTMREGKLYTTDRELCQENDFLHMRDMS